MKERDEIMKRIGIILQVILSIGFFAVLLVITGYIPQELFLKHNGPIIAIILFSVWYFIFDFFELGAISRMQKQRHFIQKYVFTVLFMTVALYMVVGIFGYRILPLKFYAVFATLNFLLLTSVKLVLRRIVKYYRRNGYNSRIILIIADDSSISFINQMIEMDDWGYRIGGIITDSDKIKMQFGKNYPIYPDDVNFENIIDREIVDEVIFCKNSFQMNRINDYIEKSQEIGVTFHIHGNTLNYNGQQPKVSFFNKQFYLSYKNLPDNYIATKLKAILDVFLSFVIFVFISPVLLIIAIAIKLEDGGPVIFKQKRVGKNGRQFNCYKFRTMVTNAEDLKEKLLTLNEQDGPVFKIKNDPRVTKTGRFLRKTSLDELPQFLNVLLGEMSIVGPRPPVPSEVKKYERRIKRRLSVSPGITCTWQVSGRNNIPFNQWMEMDMEYIDNWKLSLDLKIVLKTFGVIFKGNGQ